MRPIAALAVGIQITTATTVYAQHKIALYSDPAYTSTEVIDQTPAELTAYVVFDSPAGGTAVSFRIVPSEGFTAVWLNDSSTFLVMGSSPNGAGVAFGGCYYNALVLEVRYTMFGTSSSCSTLDIVADPQFDLFAGLPVVADCDHEYASAIAGRLTINPDPTCSPLPILPTTWGKVKSLYR